jgi:hypothetical protein
MAADGVTIGAMGADRRLSRRDALGAIVGSASTLAACGRLPSAVRPPPPAVEQPHHVGSDDIATLISAADAVVGLEIEPTHYGRYFEWHAARNRDYEIMYTDFVRALDSMAHADHRQAFASLALEDRARIVDAVVGRSAVFEERFRGEVLMLFATTDAWIHLGYPTWPGEPRGFAWLEGPLAGFKR